MNIPDRMAHLERDHRGYPIPYIVLRSDDGRAHFTVNDSARVANAAKKELCAICGKRLYRGERWFGGGPMSAFHEHGAYLDGPTHHECGTFALQTCPYLAAPKYTGRIDAQTIRPGTLEDRIILVDNTTIPDRPDVFVFACATSYKVITEPGRLLFRPKRPWVTYECWAQGRKLTREEYVPILVAAML